MFQFKPKRKPAPKVLADDERPPPKTEIMREGTFALGERLVVNRSLTEGAFLEAVGQDASPLVHNGVHRSYLINPVTLHGRCFRPGVYFTDGMITFVSLTWVDAERSTDGWKDWSKERELEVARADAVWVSSVLNGLGTMTDTYSFEWGTISSGYDDRTGGSSVIVRYR